MADKHDQHGNDAESGRSGQAEHPDPTTPTAMSSLSRAAYYGQTPRWPAAMIGPTETELQRWFQLWSDPRAAMWVETKQEHVVATLVRVEQRCGRRRPSPLAQFELDRLRSQLGLEDN